MKPIQWLLVGGPANGRTLWIKAGASVQWENEDGATFLYHAETYVYRGREYRIGVFGTIADADLPRLIDEIQLEPIF